jgi:membrane-associated phospholipid phosphatase
VVTPSTSAGTVSSASSAETRTEPRTPVRPAPRDSAAPLELFEPRPHGPAAALARRLDRRSPVLAGIFTALGAAVVLTAVLVGLGLLLTHVVFPNHPAAWDLGVDRWFARHRNATANDVTHIGSDVAETMTVILIAAVVVAVCAWRRIWRAAAFLATALFIEVSVFLLTALLIDRSRPAVPKLDTAPPTSSFPSGHTAAAVVLYVGIALIVFAYTRSTVARIAFGLVAVAAPIFVMTSRLYRGMHFPTDVAAGALLGALALVSALLVVRTAVAVAERRS